MITERSAHPGFVFRVFDLLLGRPLLWLCLVVFAGEARGLDPTRALTQYGHDSWNYQNGLPGGAVYSVVQPESGYIWLREASGLLRFDGVRFVPVVPMVDDVPVAETIRAIDCDAAGMLFVRTKTRTLALRDGRFHDHVPPARLPDGNDRVVLPARDGTIWVGADCNITRVRGSTVQIVAQGTGWVSALLQDREGTIWAGASAGLYRIRDERITFYTTGFNGPIAETFLPTERVHAGLELDAAATSLLEDSEGTMWVGTHTGLYKISEGKLIRDHQTAALAGLHVSALLQDRDGNLWAGTDGAGIFRFAGRGWTHYTSADGLSDDAICSLLEDAEGSVWIGTHAGLDRFRNASLMTIGAKEGLAHDSAPVVTEGGDGGIYVYTGGGGITRIANGVCSSITTKNGLLSDYSGTLYAARDGTLWIGTDRGLCSYRDGQLTASAQGQSLSGFYISAIGEDDDSLLVATTELKIYRYKEGAVSPYEVPLPAGGGQESIRYVFAMDHDQDGTMWLAMTAGLYRVPRGVPPEKAERTAYHWPAHTIYNDERDSIWITGPETRGIARLNKKDGRLITYGPEIGIPSSDVSRAITDLHDNLWFGTRGGIVEVSRRELDDYAAGKIQKLHPRIFGIMDGMKTEETAGNDRQPSAWRGKDGKLYFGTRKGLVVVDPDHLPQNGRVPPVMIEEFIVDGQLQASSGNLELMPGRESLEFHYTALSLLSPGRVRFKYQLEGYDDGWIEAGARRTAYYTHLPPGSYTFHVIACNEDGLWNKSGASLRFSLKPHFYQTRWFYAGCAAGVLLLGQGALQVRTRRLRRREAELLALVDERTRKLRDEVTERTLAQQELQKYRAFLEQQVTERTAALRQSNEQLQREMAERRSKEAELRASEDQLRQAQKMEAIGQLAGGIAHDFNNLLTAIIGSSECLLEDGAANPDTVTLATEIRDAGKRAAALTRQLLAFSRKQMLQPKVLNVNGVVTNLEKMLRRLIGEDVVLEKSLEPELCLVRADPNQIEQIIMNLAVNARDALPRGGRLTIRTSNRVVDAALQQAAQSVPPGRYVCLEVSDSGCGMSPEVQARVFEPFFTTKGPGKGSGLGLSTVYGIVQQSSGHITFTSAENQGTTFCVYLPVVEAPMTSTREPWTGITGFRGDERILLVEDNELVLKIAQRTLASAGFKVVEAASPVEALARCRAEQGRFDLLVTDLVMPEMSGRELAEKILEEYPGMKVLFISGYTDDALVRVGGIANISLLEKPFTPEALIRRVRAVLDDQPISNPGMQPAR